ncbi:unnamed protein product, partial [Rotaria sp. Silwood2]
RAGKVEGPTKVTYLTKETGFVSWKPPLDSGDCTSEKYVVVEQDVGRGSWAPADEVITPTPHYVSPN